MVPFAGWRMPVQYTGIIDEHLHTRANAGLFDICHMGEFYLRGKGAADDVDRLVTCRTDNQADGQCKYGFLLDEQGGVLDDLITFRISEEEYLLVVNAASLERDRQWIESHLSPDTEFADESDRTGKIDLQGPKSEDIMIQLLGPGALSALHRFRCRYVKINGVRVLLSRTGYTGEHGYELFFPIESTETLWDLLLSYPPVKPVGLGARDTLRIEKGLPLYGHELNEHRTPLEANFERFVYWDKAFIGRKALQQQKQQGIRQRLTGFVCEGRRAAREGYAIFQNEKEIGIVTSGAFSPCLKKGIGMAYVNPDRIEEGASIQIRTDRAEIEATISSVPFL